MTVDINPYTNIKLDNKHRVFRLIQEAKQISKPSISRTLKISLPTAIQHVNELEEIGCIKEGAILGKTGGRKAKSYCLNGEYRYAIGVYIFAEKIIITAVDFSGKQLFTNTVRCLFEMGNSYYKNFSNILEKQIAKWELAKDKIVGVGISIPGLVTESHQQVYYGKTLHLDITGLSVDELAKYIPYPCSLYNEADAAGYAEATISDDVSDTFYINLGENVGGAILINGKIYNGKSAKAGKIAHITMVPNGKKCYCGRNGCLNTVCTSAILRESCDGEIADFFAELKNNNLQCVKVWNDYMHYLAEAIVDVRMLFDSKIIVGGEISEYMDPYFDNFLEQVTELDTFDNPATYLKLGQIRNDAAALGAALSVIHKFWKTM